MEPALHCIVYNKIKLYWFNKLQRAWTVHNHLITGRQSVPLTKVIDSIHVDRLPVSESQV